MSKILTLISILVLGLQSLGADTSYSDRIKREAEFAAKIKNEYELSKKADALLVVGTSLSDFESIWGKASADFKFEVNNDASPKAAIVKFDKENRISSFEVDKNRQEVLDLQVEVRKLRRELEVFKEIYPATLVLGQLIKYTNMMKANEEPFKNLQNNKNNEK